MASLICDWPMQTMTRFGKLLYERFRIFILRAIERDLQRSNRSTTAVKLPSGSNTARDTANLRTSLMSQLVRHGNHLAFGAAREFPGRSSPVLLWDLSVRLRDCRR
jgi:hypothetical protein